ncbi:MAG: SAM-dependent methyltransferase [Halieaceae bacterium]|jgi:SAM-dependent methyltransferase
MIQFGRMPAGQLWAASSPDVIATAQALLSRSIVTGGAAHGSSERYIDDAESFANTTGAVCTLEFDRPCTTTLPNDIDWGLPASGLADAVWLRCTVTDLAAQPLAGLLICAQRVYRLEDLCRALEASFETGLERQGRFAVIDSRRTPRASRQRASVSVLQMALFHCDNAACPARGDDVAIELNPQELAKHTSSAVGCLAYPCPSCPGHGDSSWALTFDRIHRGGGSPAAMPPPVLHYPVMPLQTRRNNNPGPMRRVTDPAPASTWNTVWKPRALEPMSATLRHGLEEPHLALVLEALSHSASDSRYLIGQLDPGNVRAIIECCRQLPVDMKRNELAAALAILFQPRRMRSYRTDEDDTAQAAERFPYVACAPDRFLEALRYFGLMEHEGRFLDVGCGIGEKPFLAYALGRFQQCDGLEVNTGYLTIAEFLFDCIATETPYPVKLIAADALAFDSYGEYDVIYMYRPLGDAAMAGELMRQIAAQLKPQAIMFDMWDRSMSLRRGDDGIYELDPEATAQARWRGPIQLDDFLEARQLLSSTTQSTCFIAST